MHYTTNVIIVPRRSFPSPEAMDELSAAVQGCIHDATGKLAQDVVIGAEESGDAMAPEVALCQEHRLPAHDPAAIAARSCVPWGMHGKL